MSRVPELLAAIQSLLPCTQACEHLVPAVGLPPDAVATRMGLSLEQVRMHLQAARDARHALALERETSPVVHHADATWPQVVEARQSRDSEILEMVGQGLRAHQVAVRLGITADIVYRVMTADRRRKLAEMRVPRASKRAGVDERATVDKMRA